jgi:predicted RNA-binding protein with PUA-like domain
LAYWLLKSEPSTYSIDDLIKDKKTVWDGITNNLALKHIRSMQKGDLTFIYHSGNDKEIVGLAEISSKPYADPKQNNPKLVVFDIKPKTKLKKPVTLSEIKNDNRFSDFGLVRMSRLSVVPVSKDLWKILLEMAGAK